MAPTDIRRLDPAAAAAHLRAAADAGRGFLGLDPVIQNDVLLAAELTRMRAQVFQAGEMLLGAVPNPDQPRQAFVAATRADPGPLRALLGFLGSHQRCGSFVAMVPDGAASAAAFESCGFRQAGVLRDHRYQAGAYQDVVVYHAESAIFESADSEDTCSA
ncbi:MAG: GNAT family N-acetyltransferase [Actinocrinis sp.]